LRLAAPDGRPVPGETGAYLLAATSVALPLALLLFYYLREAGLLSLRGVLRVLYLGGLAGVVGWGLRAPGQWLTWLRFEIVPAAVLPEGVVSQPGLLVALLGLGLLVLVRGREALALRWTFVAALALSTAGLQGGAHWSPGADGLYLQAGLLGGAGLVLVIGVVQLSYGMAYLDGLTGLPGRRALEEELDRVGGGRYAIAMLDVDHFKKFNDRYGHEVGDQVLKLVAARMAEVGGRGRSFRYGGEEFTVLFPGRTVDEVVPHLEELREAIADSSLTIRSLKRPRKKPKKPVKRRSPGKQVSVTISIGVAGPTEKRPTPRAVLKAADKALYRAKRGGRNKVRR